MSLAEAREKARQAHFREQAEARNAGQPTKTELVIDPWDEPVALGEAIPAAPEFPLQVLPPRVREFVLAISESMHTAPDYAATAAISVASAAIGSTARLRMKGKWTEQPCLWIGLVGSSGELKSPSAKHLLEPYESEHVKRLDEKRRRDKNKSRQRRMARGIGLDGDEDDEAHTPYGPDEGELKVSNATVEGLMRVFARQRRGLLFHSDELLGWLNGFDQYRPGGKGNDRQTFLSLYDGGRMDVLRAGESRHVNGCCLNVLGTIQPRMMGSLFKDPDGLAARFLWAFPEPSRAVEEDWATPPEDLYQDWAAIVHVLLRREMKRIDDIDGLKLEPEWYVLSDDGRDAWAEFSRWYADEQNNSPDGSIYHSFSGKLRGFGARLAVIMRVLWEAGDVVDDPSCTVNRIDVERAAELAKYFAAMAQRVYAAGSADARVEGAKRILDWIRRNQVKEFTRAQLWSTWARARTEYVRPEDLHDPVNLLVACHLIRWKERGYFGVGRKPTPMWEVHPSLLQEPTP